MSKIEELAAAIGRWAPSDGIHPSAVPRVTLIRSSTVTEPIHTIYKPSVCIVAQGRKQAMLGTGAFIYDPAKFLVAAIDLPVVGSVIEAAPERPYLCFCLDLDLTALGEVALGLGGSRPARIDDSIAGLALIEAAPGLIDAALRLVQLHEEPQAIATLAPLAEREILFRLLTSQAGPLIQRIATSESRLAQIGQAIGWMKANYALAFGVERLASIAGMSPSAFYDHFRQATSLTPLQYRNQLRLQEARRLMVVEGFDAAAAGFRVGFESPSQFSRDYGRLFGAPPARDAARLRASTYPLVA